MDNLGIARFYYSATVPDQALPVAEISARVSNPQQLIDINGTPYAAGPLTVTPIPAGPVLDAAVAGNTVLLSGAGQYLLANQFFEITDQVDIDGNPLYYRHPLPSAVDHVSIEDLNGDPVTAAWRLADNSVLHNLDGQAYRVRYYERQVYRTRLLQYQPALTRGAIADAGMYVFNPGGLLTVPDAGATYRLRFTAENGYTLLAPYGAPPNDPWYPRVRFNLRPVTPEWANQLFQPVRPYMLGTWVPGRVIASDLIEFERKKIWFDPLVGQYPDILVYDRDFHVKYALDGVPANLSRPVDKGYLFPWKTSQIADIDPYNGRLQVNPPLDPTDQVFGFYNYAEMDVVFRAIDVNPFSNPAVKDRIVEFYWADRGNDIPPR